jgi:hypothetical protein
MLFKKVIERRAFMALVRNEKPNLYRYDAYDTVPLAIALLDRN